MPWLITIDTDKNYISNQDKMQDAIKEVIDRHFTNDNWITHIDIDIIDDENIINKEKKEC